MTSSDSEELKIIIPTEIFNRYCEFFSKKSEGLRWMSEFDEKKVNAGSYSLYLSHKKIEDFVEALSDLMDREPHERYWLAALRLILTKSKSDLSWRLN
jgi:hypothetical protein